MIVEIMGCLQLSFRRSVRRRQPAPAPSPAPPVPATSVIQHDESLINVDITKERADVARGSVEVASQRMMEVAGTGKPSHVPGPGGIVGDGGGAES